MAQYNGSNQTSEATLNETPRIDSKNSQAMQPHELHTHPLEGGLTSIMDDGQLIVASPINKNPKSNSHRDFTEQQKRSEQGLQRMWDDSRFNKQKPGGLFAFVHNGKEVIFHYVTEVLPSNERLPSWSNNVGQSDRQVLYLSSKYFIMPWEDWISFGAPAKVQGTQHVISAKNKLCVYFDI